LKRLFIVVVAIALGWIAVQRLGSQRVSGSPEENTALVTSDAGADLPREPGVGDQFSCDGRVYCSQMTSCKEAKFFLAHCPGTKMDGDGDGIPCEKQFCGL
jgi:hypothetical protein